MSRKLPPNERRQRNVHYRINKSERAELEYAAWFHDCPSLTEFLVRLTKQAADNARQGKKTLVTHD